MILADFAVKSAIVLTLAFGIVGLMRRASAASRHAVWTAAFGAVLLLPLASITFPPLPLRVLPADQPAPFVIAPSATPSVPALVDAPDSSSPRAKNAALPAAPAMAPTRTEQSTAPWTWGRFATTIWFFGGIVMLARIAVGALTVRRLASRTRRADSPRLLSPINSIATSLGVRRPIVTLIAAADVMPATWGAFRPTLLLPSSAEDWPDVRLNAVLVHELAHVARWDSLSQAVARVAVALLWFNPLAWAAAGRARLERERACDDRVIESGTRASDYAHQLLALMSLGRPAGASTSLAMARRSHLAGRLSAILDTGVNRRGPSRATLALAVGFIVVTLPLAAARPAARLTEQLVTSSIGDIRGHVNLTMPATATDQQTPPVKPTPVAGPPQVPVATHPDFSGTWIPDEPAVVQRKFETGLSTVPGDGIIIAQTSTTFTVTRLVPDYQLLALVAISPDFKISTVVHLDDARWNGDQLVVPATKGRGGSGAFTYSFVINSRDGKPVVVPGLTDAHGKPFYFFNYDDRFTSTQFPSATSTELSSARALYGLLTGRVASDAAPALRLRIDGAAGTSPLFLHRKPPTPVEREVSSTSVTPRVAPPAAMPQPSSSIVGTWTIPYRNGDFSTLVLVLDGTKITGTMSRPGRADPVTGSYIDGRLTFDLAYNPPTGFPGAVGLAAHYSGSLQSGQLAGTYRTDELLGDNAVVPMHHTGPWTAERAITTLPAGQSTEAPDVDVFVSGEVQSPGHARTKRQLTLSAAIAQVGGYRAAAEVLEIRRRSSGTGPVTATTPANEYRVQYVIRAELASHPETDPLLVGGEFIMVRPGLYLLDPPVKGFGAGAFRPRFAVWGLAAPVVLASWEPPYTAAGMAAKLQGTIDLEVVVDTDGTVREARVVKGLDEQLPAILADLRRNPVGHNADVLQVIGNGPLGLDANAVECVKTWTFTPGTVLGTPRPMVQTVSVEFKLR